MLGLALRAASPARAATTEPGPDADGRADAPAAPAAEGAASSRGTRPGELVSFRLLQVQSVVGDNPDAPQRRLRNTRVNPFDPESLRRFFRER